MNKPHVHAEFIKSKADGYAIQERLLNTLNWIDMPEEDFGFCPTCEYRVKPEREWPVTSLNDKEVCDIYCGTPGQMDALFAVCNAAIKQYILDTEAKK